MRNINVREIRMEEFSPLGEIMVKVYSQLEGFPSAEANPAYYAMLADIGSFTLKPEVKVLVAESAELGLLGGIVYFGDMSQYGSGGTATAERNASGIRLLGVGPEARGLGAGKALTLACIQLAREKRHPQVILHSTKAMQTAWNMYEKLGFQRSVDLDFMQGPLPVFGFRLQLN